MIFHSIKQTLTAYVSIALIISSFFSAPGWGAGPTGTVQFISAFIKGSAIALPLVIIIITSIYQKQKIDLNKMKAAAWVLFPLVLLGFYGVFTCLWSPIPELSAMRSISLIVVLMSCIMISTLFTYQSIENALFLVRDTVLNVAGVSVFLVVLAGLLHINVFWRYDGRLGGQIIPTNTLAALSGLVLGMSLIRILSRERIVANLVFLIPSLLSLYFCYSRSAFISFLFSLTFSWAWEKLKYPANLRQSYLNLSFILFSCAILLFILFSNSELFLHYLLRSERTIEDLQTASSRTLLWEKMTQNPGFWIIPGLGYSAVSETGFINLGSLITNHAHNGYLQVFMGTGLIGIYFILWFFTRIYRLMMAWKPIPLVHKRVMIYAVIFFLINNLSEASMGYQIYPQIVILLLIFAPVCAHLRGNMHILHPEQ